MSDKVRELAAKWRKPIDCGGDPKADEESSEPPADWKKCPQCGRENSVVTWERFGGKCPNCNDLFDKEQYFASGYTREELKQMHPTVFLPQPEPPAKPKEQP